MKALYAFYPAIVFMLPVYAFFDTPTSFLKAMEKIELEPHNLTRSKLKECLSFFLVMLDYENSQFKPGQYTYQNNRSNHNMQYSILPPSKGAFFAYDIKIENEDAFFERKNYLGEYLFEIAKTLVDLKVIE